MIPSFPGRKIRSRLTDTPTPSETLSSTLIRADIHQSHLGGFYNLIHSLIGDLMIFRKTGLVVMIALAHFQIVLEMS